MQYKDSSKNSKKIDAEILAANQFARFLMHMTSNAIEQMSWDWNGDLKRIATKVPSSISWIIPSFKFSFQFVLLHLFGLIVVNHVTKHVTIQLQHALENVFLDVDVLLDMFSMMVIVLNQNDARPMLNLKRKRILSNALTGEIKLFTTDFRIFSFFSWFWWEPNLIKYQFITYGP